MKDYETEKHFRRVDKFGIQLLIAFTFTISLLVGLNMAFAQTQLRAKPIQCGSKTELLELITGNNRPFAPISISSDFSADPGQFTLISLNALTSCEFQGLVLLLTGK